MQTYIHEMGIIDKQGNTHPVYFKQGLNVVTGKSSTGKSALIEIFDYCFASGENTVPEGVITDNAFIYYIFLNVNNQDMVIGRKADNSKKGFFRREESYEKEKITQDYFSDAYFIPLDHYKKHLRQFFLDIDDVDDSLEAKANRRNHAKAATPSIRSFVSFMLQHQNLVANKHALFYRFDEKAKRDQAIDHTKIFLGLVDQSYFLLSQEKERLSAELKGIQREQDTYRKVTEIQKQKVEPALRQLYAAMGIKDDPVSITELLRHPQDAKDTLEKFIQPEKIDALSDKQTQYYLALKRDRDSKTSQLRKFQRQSNSIKHHISEENRFVENGQKFVQNKSVNVAKSVCPVCHTEHEKLQESAEQFLSAMTKLSNNLQHAKPMRAKFKSSLVEVERNIEALKIEISKLTKQIGEIEETEKALDENKNLYQSILMMKARLYVLLESLTMADDNKIEERLKLTKSTLKDIEKQLKSYDFKKGLNSANQTVNKYMADIGQHFEFEDSYKPINLHFSFETFDLYHLATNEKKIYLRSMGSGANWLYCHITLFLALHKYFLSLGEQCAIPSLLFLDQPTQVYFPSFKYDNAKEFTKEQIAKLEHRDENGGQIDVDMKAVENLFSQLSMYCTNNEIEFGFAPQIIVTDHADDLTLSDGVGFESLVNGNRWRERGLINPVPALSKEVK